MGLGHALMEEMIYEDGKLRNGIVHRCNGAQRERIPCPVDKLVHVGIGVSVAERIAEFAVLFGDDHAAGTHHDEYISSAVLL